MKQKIEEDKLQDNLDRLHTTEAGENRIRKNLGLDMHVKDIVAWCRSRIEDKRSEITREGKNWYVKSDDCRITINASSFTIITAHRLRKE